MPSKPDLLIAVLAALVGGTANAKPMGCHWIDGRLTLGNGTPAIRIWPRGTHRLLGVTTADSKSESRKALPAALWTFLHHNRTTRVWGSFKVCPIAADRRGWMRPVTVIAVRNLELRS